MIAPLSLITQAFAPFAEMPRWIVWESVPAEPKARKVPMSPKGGKTGTNEANAHTWGTLAEAARAMNARNIAGIGLVIPEGVICVDLDHCTLEPFGDLQPWARQIVEALDTFTEYSPSGTGVHAWLYGVKPGERCRKGSVEIYDGPFGRYITCTGRGFSRWGEMPIAERTDAIAEVYRQHLDVKPHVVASPSRNGVAQPVLVGPVAVARPGTQRTMPPGELTDGQVLDCAFGSDNGRKIEALWRGDTSAHGNDQSSAELALASHLVWWCAGDQARLMRLMDGSPLCDRDKWHERADYRQRTVEKALSGFDGEGWSGPTRKSAEKHLGVDEAARLFGTRMGTKRVSATADVLTEPVASAEPHAGADGFALTDLGNAERLVARVGGRVAWNHEGAHWLVWSGIVWEPDTTGELRRIAASVARDLWASAAAEETDNGRKELRRHASRSESRRALTDAVLIAQDRPGLFVPPGALDANPDVIVVRRGILDLRTGEMSPHDPARWLTKAVRHRDPDGRMVVADYQPGISPASHPVWDGFLCDVQPDPEMRAYLRRAAGLSLSGWTRDTLHLHWGTGANGKSTFLDTLRCAFGHDYSHVAGLDVLVARKTDAGAPNPAVADLRGKRFVIASEAGANDRLAESTVKAITSQGEPITARRLHQNPSTFLPIHTLHLHSNHRPIVRGTDDGVWRRVDLIPWTVTIPESQRDEALKARLQTPEVLLGVLGWAIGGAEEVAITGLCPPQAVRLATAQYRVESDIFGQWLDEYCYLIPDAVATGGALYENYKLWSEKNGHRPQASNLFSERIGSVAGVRRGTGRARYSWFGISVRKMSTEEWGDR